MRIVSSFRHFEYPFRGRGSLIGVLLSVITLLSGCGIANWMGGDTVTLWANRYEFVRLQPQGEWQGRPPPPNQQPVMVSPGRIAGALRLLLVRTSPDEDLQPLFSEHILKKLSSFISEGLAEAGPHQDVTFAIEDWYKSGFLRGNKVVSARVFYVDNRLNVIFGSLLRDGPMADGHAEATARNPDPRINPFVPGSRQGSIKSPVMLSAPPNRGVFKQAGGRRNDWMVFTDQALVRRSAVSYDDRRIAASGEIQDLRREIQTLKQQVGSGGTPPPGTAYPPGYPPTGYPPTYQPGYPPPGYAPPGSAPYQPGYQPPGYPPPGSVAPGYPVPYAAPYPPGSRAPAATQAPTGPPTSRDDIARRIAMLDGLRQKGLISQDEYNRKRQAILDGF